MDIFQFFRDVDSRNINVTDYMAVERTILATKRTLLAYVRTALATFGGGIGILHFTQTFLLNFSGWFLVFSSFWILVAGYFEYTRARDSIEKGLEVKYPKTHESINSHGLNFDE